MKAETTEFGFEVLATYLLPGIVALIAIAINHGLTMDQLEFLSTWAKDAELISSLVIIGLVALCGFLIATFQAALETWILDWLTPWTMKISRQDFQTQWSNYIKKLKDHENSYLSRVVLFFQFETRLGISLFYMAWALHRHSMTHVYTAFFAGVFFYLMGIAHHRELADYRKENCK